MTTITWKIVQLEHEITDGLVIVVHYTVDAENGIYRANSYGSINLKRSDDNFIPFTNLTEKIVVGWVKDQLTAEKVAEVEAALQNQLDEQAAPTKAVGLPWT